MPSRHGAGHHEQNRGLTKPGAAFKTERLIYEPASTMSPALTFNFPVIGLPAKAEVCVACSRKSKKQSLM